MGINASEASDGVSSLAKELKINRFHIKPGSGVLKDLESLEKTNLPTSPQIKRLSADIFQKTVQASYADTFRLNDKVTVVTDFFEREGPSGKKFVEEIRRAHESGELTEEKLKAIIEDFRKSQDNVQQTLKSQKNNDVTSLSKDPMPEETDQVTSKGAVYVDGELFNRGDTNMWRQDITWENVPSFIYSKYCWEPKVNVYMAAGSKGEEAYTVSMSLQHSLGEGANKFFPLRVCDINADVIEANKIAQETDNVITYRRNRTLTRQWLNLSNEQTDKYITIVDDESAKLTKIVTEPVQFRHANVLNDLKNINVKGKDVPTIFFARNMWPYVDEAEYDKFAAELYNTLAPNSCVFIGSYDLSGGKEGLRGESFAEALKRAGFKPNADCKVQGHGQYGAIVFEKN